jgi:hypothetical protein
MEDEGKRPWASTRAADGRVDIAKGPVVSMRDLSASESAAHAKRSNQPLQDLLLLLLARRGAGATTIDVLLFLLSWLQDL